MACSGCRQSSPLRNRTPVRQESALPCALMDEAGGDILVEVQRSGLLLAKTPYNSQGMGLARALAVLGCRGQAAASMKTLEAEVQTAVSDPARAPRFWAALPSTTTTIAAVATALARTH